MNKAERRKLRKTLGSRTERRRLTKVKDGSMTRGTGKKDSIRRKRREKPSAKLNKLIVELANKKAA